MRLAFVAMRDIIGTGIERVNVITPMAESNGVRQAQSTIIGINCFNVNISFAFLC